MDEEVVSSSSSEIKKTTKKRKIQPYFHIKAHSNPLSDKDFIYPVKPDDFDLSKHFTNHSLFSQGIQFADIGCGYGGLLVNLGSSFPNTLSVGMEIRDKVVEYVQERILKLRSDNLGNFGNISVILTNAMKNLPNFFRKGQLKKLFFLFPDPHFKKANHRRRIVSPQLLAEYAYVLASGGIVYTVTDVEELHFWMVSHFDNFPLFQRLTEQELEGDSVIPLVLNSSEESRKVDRIKGKKFLAVFKRL